MKRFIGILLVLMLIPSAFSGCMKNGEETETAGGEITEEITKETTKENDKEIESENKILLPFDEVLEFYFSSGAGAWGTELYLEKDGSFNGSFHDSNMGEIGENNPNGTCYVCDFAGKFEIVEKIDEVSYKMTITEITTEKEEGEQWIEDGVLYVASTPYGLDGGTEFIFYTPGAETDNVKEEFLWWWPYRFEEEFPETLQCYGIHNINTDDGFFTY